MQVYVVYDALNESPLGVFSTEELAKQAIQKWIVQSPTFSKERYLEIHNFTLDDE